jgi:serine-type D-Ala-D-Ala endopeptidase (penicillin-binding protein 7)
MRNILSILLFIPLFAFATANTVVYNVTDHRVLDGSLDNSQVSIASISKLMTVYTVLKEEQDLNEKLTVEDGRVTNTHIRKGMVLSRIDLINLALISSDNLAAQTLSENFPGGKQNFVRTMNQHAFKLGMFHTGFVEPTGLSPMNYSSVNDIVQLTQIVSQFQIVQNAAKSQKVVTETTVVTKKGKKRKVSKVQGNPTSRYFGHDGIITIKTGFTNAAGFCITMLVYAHDKLYNITVLGARSSRERQQIVERSLNTIYNA